MESESTASVRLEAADVSEDGTWPRVSKEHTTCSTRDKSTIFAKKRRCRVSRTRKHPTRPTDDDKGSWKHCSSSTSGYISSSTSTWSTPSSPGLCGLSNLGNTDFMNSALQCLSNTRPLTEYFDGTPAGYKPYKKHINKSNPLGMGGAITEAYGALLEDMWEGKVSCVAPRQFKTQVDRYAPQCAQHDPQEFLALLLNALNEDLNLVKTKPHVNMIVETENRSDKEVADEAWMKYLQRNQSVIVRLFQGQLRSTLICPDCEKVSKTFDPFMFLSLPLPINTRSLTVTLVPLNSEHLPTKYKLQLSKRGSVKDLRRELAKLSEVDSTLMTVVDVYNSRFHRIYSERDSLSLIMDRDNIYVYEMSGGKNEEEFIHVPVYHREDTVRDIKYSSSTSYQQHFHQLFGLPMVVTVPRECSYSTLYQAVLDKGRRYIKSYGGELSLFKLTVVNSYGSQEVQKLEPSKTYKLSGQTYIACDWQTELKEKCYDLPLAEEIALDNSYNAVEGIRRNIMDCLKLFTQTETLSKDDAWYCPNCKEFVQATKKFDLWHLPDIVVIHLKRFSYDRKDKLNEFVNFPINSLDLTELVHSRDDPQPLYDLFAVTNHFGDVEGGHYTAYAKNRMNQKWYNFDDSHVAETSEDHLVSSSAYVLFYQRRTEGQHVNILDFAEEIELLSSKYSSPPSTVEEEIEGENNEVFNNNNELKQPD